MEYRDSSELQLLEVSRGVRKLTQMIDSWSKAPNLDARSKYMAKDLLRDSLALQESLITIRRLQETSRMMSFMDQKLQFGSMKERKVEEEENSVAECGSLRVGGGIYSLSTNASSRNYANEKKCDIRGKLNLAECGSLRVGGVIYSLSTNASSRNYANEKKCDIRGKLNQQNLVSVFSNHDGDSSNRLIDFPTSSSFSWTDNSEGMTDLTMRAKAPNLIAKLMGLEKIPAQVVQSVKKEQRNDKNVYKQTLDYKNSRIQSCFASDALRSHGNGREASTIVVMKPLQLLARENEGEKQRKKENLSAELSLKKEISCDGYKLSRKKAVNRMDKASMVLFPKLRTQAPVTNKQQTKEPLALDVNKVGILNGKASEERRDVKINSHPLFQPKRVKEPPAKSDKKLATAKGGAQASCIQSSTSRKSNSITNAKTISKHSAISLMEEDKKKVEKMSGRSKNIKTANTKCKGVGKTTVPTNKASDFCRSISTSSIHGFPHQLVEDSKLVYGENTRMGSKSFCEVMPKASKGGKQRISVNSATPPYDKTLYLKEAAWSQKDIQLLLLTSSTFLTKAGELFGFNVQMLRAKSHQNSNFESFGATTPHKLLLGCAMELTARRSYQLELLNHPICRTYRQNSELLISLEQLVVDVSKGIKDLNDYCRAADLEDDPYLRLERDLRCKDMFLNGLWDFGWIGWVCVEEFATVVEQIGEDILCGIVREVAFDSVH